MPSHFSEGQVARVIYADMPNAISKLVLTFLGTEKLERQLAEPDFGEVAEPKFVTFLRNGLLADMRLGNWEGRLKGFVEQVRQNRYLLEAVVWKVNELLRLGGLDTKPRKTVQALLAGAIGDLKGATKEDRRTITEKQVKRIRLQDLVRRLTASEEDEA